MSSTHVLPAGKRRPYTFFGIVSADLLEPVIVQIAAASRRVLFVKPRFAESTATTCLQLLFLHVSSCRLMMDISCTKGSPKHTRKVPPKIAMLATRFRFPSQDMFPKETSEEKTCVN